jgi:protein-disulfide isomerase
MQKRPIMALVLGLLLGAGLGVASAQADETPSPAQRQMLDQVIHDYLLSHPEVVIEALKAADAKAKAQQENEARAEIVKHRDELLHDPASPVAGNPDGDVTIVEFFDYRCPYCKQMEPALEALLKEDGKVRVVYKEFPILGPESQIASQVSLAAMKQSAQKYNRLHTALMNAKGQLTQESILKHAEAAGLDIARIKTDMASPEIDALIRRNMDLADALSIRGTPAIIIGDGMSPGAIDLGTLRKMVADARKAG